MPYKRARSSPYSRYKPKGRVYNGGYKKVYKPKTTLVRVVPVEIKFFDTVYGLAGIPAGPATNIDSTIVNVVNGTGPSDRVGRKIKVTQIDYSFTVYLNGGAVGINTDAFRFDIFLDKQCNGAAPTALDLYTAVAGVPGTCQFLNILNEKRFKRLFTTCKQMNILSGIAAVNTSSNVGVKVEGSIYPNCIIEYDASAGLVTDITSNNIVTAWGSDLGFCVAAATSTRVHYTDA